MMERTVCIKNDRQRRLEIENWQLIMENERLKAHLAIMERQDISEATAAYAELPYKVSREKFIENWQLLMRNERLKACMAWIG